MAKASLQNSSALEHLRTLEKARNFVAAWPDWKKEPGVFRASKCGETKEETSQPSNREQDKK